MELDDLKTAWTALDNRLKRTEELKESIILEMMTSKAKKLINRFVAWEMFQVVLSLFCLPLCIYAFNLRGGKYWTLDAVLFFSTAVCFTYPFWGVLKTHGLMKFDITKNVGNNILCMNRYSIQLKREKKLLYFILPFVVTLGVLHYAAMKASLPLWTLLVCMFIFIGLVSYWSYKYYDKGIDSILKSLDEIQELKEK
jgi:hypothetical protein